MKIFVVVSVLAPFYVYQLCLIIYILGGFVHFLQKVELYKLSIKCLQIY